MTTRMDEGRAYTPDPDAPFAWGKQPITPPKKAKSKQKRFQFGIPNSDIRGAESAEEFWNLHAEDLRRRGWRSKLGGQQ